MNPLRPLAKDWNYRVTADGWLFVRTGGPEIFTAIPYRSAPAECFADAPVASAVGAEEPIDPYAILTPEDKATTRERVMAELQEIAAAKTARSAADAKPAEPVRKGDRVVVVDDTPRWNGRRGFISEVGIRMPIGRYEVCKVIMDTGGGGHLFKPTNLRHERDDERPAEPKPEPPPVHMTVALVDGRIQVNLDPVEGGGANHD